MAIIFDGRFQQGASLSAYTQQISGSLELLADPLGSDETVLRTTISSGDSEVAGGIRTEIVPTDVSLRVQGGEYWYWMAYLIPDDWAIVEGEATAQGFIIHQVHDTPDGGDPPRHATITLDVIGSEVWFLRSYEGVSGYDIMHKETLVKGVWHTVVFNALWAADASGKFVIWHDYRKVMNITGQASNYDDAVGPYYKEGLYKVSSAASWPPGVTSRTCYHKGVAVGDDSYSSLNDFLAALDIPAEELEGFGTAGSFVV